LFIGGTHPAANGGAWLAVIKGLLRHLEHGRRRTHHAALAAELAKGRRAYKFAKNSYEITVEKSARDDSRARAARPHPEFLVQGHAASPVQ